MRYVNRGIKQALFNGECTNCQTMIANRKLGEGHSERFIENGIFVEKFVCECPNCKAMVRMSPQNITMGKRPDKWYVVAPAVETRR